MFDSIVAQIILGGGTLYAGSYLIPWISTKYKNYLVRKLEKDNIMTIVHTSNSSISSILGIDKDNSMISIKTHMDFIKTYEKLDKDKDIHLIIHTTGGALSSAEAICNCISNHTGKGKFICYVPYYAYSGGAMIMLSCDKVVMLKNAIIGPCDAQKPTGSLVVHSVASIIDTVNYKKSKDEKISEEWLASCYDANLCKERQREYVNKLVKENRFPSSIAEIIYTEFFSGKYNHDKVFSAQEALALGVNIEIVDKLPDHITNVVNDIK